MTICRTTGFSRRTLLHGFSYLLQECYGEESFAVNSSKTYRGTRGTALAVLNFGARRERVLDFTLRPLYLQEKTTVLIE
jgi:hypothetical protein